MAHTMISRVLPRRFVPLLSVVVTTVFAGCAGTVLGGDAVDPCQQVKYEGKGMEPYADAAHEFAVCVPDGLTRKGPAGYDDGRVVFSGFAVPAGTNLESKTLVIVAGTYPDVQGNETPFGHFTAGGVTFERTRFYEGHMGHSDMHIIYTGKIGGKTLHLDFIHFAVSPYGFDPSDRPAIYDEDAQVKLTEVIMGTFRSSK